MGIIILGGTGAGKSTVAALLAERTGFPLYEVGHVVKQFYLESMIQQHITKANDYYSSYNEVRGIFQQHSKDYITQKRLQYTDEIIRKYGNDYFVKALIKMHQSEQLIIVGPRTQQEIEAIKCFMKTPFFVGLTCEVDELTKRFVNRESSFMDRFSAKSIFIKRHDTENMRGINSVMNYCDIVVSTENHNPYILADYIFAAYIQSVNQRETIS